MCPDEDIETLKIACKYSFLSGMTYKYSDQFVDPIDLNINSDYLLFVKQPICLSQISNKIDNRQYRNKLMYLSDVELIKHNTILYNGDDKLISKYSKILVSLMKRAFEWAMDRMERGESVDPLCAMYGLYDDFDDREETYSSSRTPVVQMVSGSSSPVLDNGTPPLNRK